MDMGNKKQGTEGRLQDSSLTGPVAKHDWKMTVPASLNPK